MPYSIRDIATALGAEAEGDLDITVSGAAEPALASASQLALAMDPKYAPGLSKGQAQAALLWLGADWRALGLKAAIFAPRGRRGRGGGAGGLGDCAFRDHRRRRAHRGAGADRKPCVDCRRRGDRG